MKKYINAYKFAKICDGFPSYQTLRTLIRDREKNGFNKVVLKINGQYLICPEDFEKWVEEQRNN
jgi:hypothetical protein